MKNTYRIHICPECTIYNQCNGQKLEEVRLSEEGSQRILHCPDFENLKQKEEESNESTDINTK